MKIFLEYVLGSYSNSDLFKRVTTICAVLRPCEIRSEPESKTRTEFGYYLGYSKRGINTGRPAIIFGNYNAVIDYSV